MHPRTETYASPARELDLSMYAATSQELGLISDTIIRASRLRDVDAICQLVADTVHRTNHCTRVLVSLYDRQRKAIRLRAYAGVGDVVQRAINILGHDPRDMVFKLSDLGEQGDLYLTGRLGTVPLYDLLTGKVPRVACRTLERFLGIDKIYVVGFSLGKDPYGGIIIMSPAGHTIQHASAIETLASHLSEMIQRRQAEVALEASEARFRTIFHSVNDAIWMCNPEGVLQDVNDTACRMLGYTHEELLGKHVEALHAPAEGPEVRDRLARILRGELTVFETTHLRRDDTEVAVEVNARLTKFDGDQVILSTVRDISRRVEAERNMRRAAEQFSKAFHSGPLLMSISTIEDSRYVEVNENFLKLTGYTRDEVIGSTSVDLGLLAADDQATLTQTILSQGRFEHVTLVLTRKSGEELPCLFFGEVITVAGTPMLLSLAEDISERTRSEARFRALTENAPVGIFIHCGECFRYVNPAMVSLTGFSEAELHKMSFWEIVHEDFVDMVKARGVARREGKQRPSRYDFAIIDRDGEKRWVSFAGALTDYEGQPAIIGTAYETTDRVQAQNALRESEHRYRLLADNTLDAIWTTDLDGNVQYVNPAIQPLLGYTPLEFVGTNIGQHCNPADLIEMLPPTNPPSNQGQSPLRSNQVTTCEGDFRRKNGDYVAVDIRRHWILDETGRPTGIQGVCRDITERRRLEEQLTRHERLAAVGQLAAGIAHDFRNLLTTIILYADISQRYPDLPSKLIRNLRTIISESRKATHLIQQVLDFSSQSMIELEPVNLELFITEVMTMLRRTIPESIHLVLQTRDSVDDQAFIVEADKGRIQQVLTNLTINARDAMPGGGKLRFKLSRLVVAEDNDAPPVAEMTPGSWICLSVSDTGTGMTEEVQSHLFEPFFTTKGVGKGSGLGLAQVYGIIRQHHGAIDVDTAPGRGTTFHIYLPATSNLVASQQPQHSVNPAPQGYGETILLVEDQIPLQDAEKTVLESLGYKVQVAYHGRQALQMVREGATFDLLITDIVMPEMGGPALVRELHRTTPSLKAVGLTGYTDEDRRAELTNLGFLDVLRKPIDLDQLARTVRHALDQDP